MTSHEARPATLGVARTTADLEALVDVPGPLTVESVVGADWAVARSGLVNLDHPKAKDAGLVEGLEPIVVGFHAIHHPTRGLFLVDTGAERALRDDREHTVFGGLIGRFMHADLLRVRQDTGGWLGGRKVSGVFLTHMHLDHLTGMRDVPDDAPIFTGPGESSEVGLVPRLLRSATDQALEGKGALNELQFGSDGVLDVLGDGSFWAIHVPGHTKGSTAFLARTRQGPVLLTGDACHTRWGWDHGVEPGSFSEDRPMSAKSLARLRDLVARHPKIEVRMGHQGFEPPARVGALDR
ncbi:MAG: MBL fold metallo-hydrolase [Deltaproteobacteria bacterium]|nr:MBL fold metallo-hydrolase [Deltaproteobacteria bacterium]